MAGVVVLGGGSTLRRAIRTEVPVEVLLDVIQPYPTFSEAVFFALQELEL